MRYKCVTYWERESDSLNLAIVLPLKSKLSGKVQRFDAIHGSTEMLKNGWISENFN